MKKFLLSLLCLISFMAINAETYTYDFSKNSLWVTTSGGSTVVGTGSSNKLNAFYYKNTGECFNAGGKGYFNNGYFLWGKSGAYIEVPTFDGEKITNITAHSSTGHSVDVTVNVLTSDGKVASTQIKWATTSSDYSYDIKDEYQSSVLRLQVTNSKNSQLTKLTITTVATSGEVVETVAKPVITPASGEITADTEISIECATEDATIKYTIDGTEPSAENGTEYIEPFTLNADATVKAIAIKDGYNNSAVASATYTLFKASEYSYQPVTSVVHNGHYIIVGKKGEDYFAMGAKREGKNNRESISITLDKNGVIANPSVKVYEIEVQGSEGAWDLYSPNENAYLYNDNGGSNKLILSSESTEETKATITFNETAAVITFINVTGAAADKNGIITQANILQYNSSDNLFSCYKNTQQLVYLYRRINDLKVATPEISIDKNDMISITCATEGATIYYTTDGTEPTTASTPYTEAFKLTKSSLTVKAIAVKDGYENSEVASEALVPVAIEEVGVDAGEAVYYNLQGVKVANPENGIFIKKQGAKATKVIL